MKIIINTVIVLLLTIFLVTGCSSPPEPKPAPYNDADSQRTRADKAQRELSSDTMRSE